MLPPPLFTRTILQRATVLWVLVRLIAAAVSLGSLLLSSSAATAVVFVGVTASLAAYELRRRGEWLLLANVGVSPVTLLLLSAAPPVALEGALALLLVALP